MHFVELQRHDNSKYWYPSETSFFAPGLGFYLKGCSRNKSRGKNKTRKVLLPDTCSYYGPKPCAVKLGLTSTLQQCYADADDKLDLFWQTLAGGVIDFMAIPIATFINDADAAMNAMLAVPAGAANFHARRDAYMKFMAALTVSKGAFDRYNLADLRGVVRE